MENKRLIELRKIPLILSIIFWILFYILLKVYFQAENNQLTWDLKTVYEKYTMFTPILFSILSIIFFYILLLIKTLFRLNFLIVLLLIYFLSFWFFLFLGLDFMFFEKRDAIFALTIINTFSIPLIVSSWIILFLVILLSFFRIKK